MSANVQGVYLGCLVVLTGPIHTGVGEDESVRHDDVVCVTKPLVPGRVVVVHKRDRLAGCAGG